MNTLTRKQRERHQRQTAILDVAERLFHRIGYDKTTIEDIAHEAEFAKGTIYLYFSSKEDIISGLIDRGLEQLVSKFQKINQTEATGLEAYRQMGDTFVSFFQKHPSYPKIFALFHSIDAQSVAPEIFEHKKTLVEEMARAIARGIDDGSIRSDVEPAKTALLTAMTAASFVHQQIKHVPPAYEVCTVSPSELLQYLFSLLSQAIEAKASGQKK